MRNIVVFYYLAVNKSYIKLEILDNNMVWALMNTVIAIIVVVALFDTILKGIALWKAGNSKQLGWFIALFILNTAGILPIIYLLFFQKKKIEAKEAPKRRRRRWLMLLMTD